MTYSQLLEELLSLSPSQLNDTVTIFSSIENEYYGISNSALANDTNDVLDTGHFYLVQGEM